ncbi:hypothetical protein ACFPOG_12315 [Paenibacillus aestuarii]|uniref:Phage protein n=1 Tax=Paenibacillus aestuarii TaxID=516965 RepID=A0ABW0K6K8_9BACL
MEYRVKVLETGEEKVLHHTEVNDMVENAGRIIVFDTKMEPHILIDDEEKDQYE